MNGWLRPRMGELMKRELWDIRDRGAVNGEI